MPQFPLARFVKRTHPQIKVLLAGEGADEIFGGYARFSEEPLSSSPHAHLSKRMLLTRSPYSSELLRVKCMCAANGMEARVPFLDPDIVRMALALSPRPSFVTKSELRAAFSGMLPDDLLWRKKTQFASSVGDVWLDALREGLLKQLYGGILAVMLADAPKLGVLRDRTRLKREERERLRLPAPDINLGHNLAWSQPGLLPTVADDPDLSALGSRSGAAGEIGATPTTLLYYYTCTLRADPAG